MNLPYKMNLPYQTNFPYQMNLPYSSGVNLVRSLGVVNPVAEIFDSSRKNFRFSGKNSDFPDKKLCLFSLNIHIFTFLTYILS